jgi:CMP-N,N'-diacetyllegionaminic acid synthase
LKEVLCIIPARGGSKGLPDKNIRLLAGHPLIAYSIKAALDCSVISRIIVSTDSNTIAVIAKSYGAEIPFMRPATYAQDLSTDFEVFDHALQWLEKYENYIPDLVVHLRPTSPVRFINDIKNGVSQLHNSDADSLRAVTPVFNNPFKMWIVEDRNNAMTPLLNLETMPEAYNQPRQNLPQIYWQTGTLDVIKTQVIRQQKSMSGNKILPYLIEQKSALDIDDIDSFDRAEEMIKKYDCIKFQP